jgi:hypothetical protein
MLRFRAHRTVVVFGGRECQAGILGQARGAKRCTYGSHYEKRKYSALPAPIFRSNLTK